jgi:predicted subunit of tRNA(5-methylaminomethyl-2-thiouridylate) methyltransferase
VTNEQEKQINELVYWKYPIEKKESTCEEYRQYRAELRKLYRVRLESEIEQKHIQEKAPGQNEFL